VVIVEDEVDHSNEIEGDHEQPKERTYPYCEKGKDTVRRARMASTPVARSQ
jgi:hypothetical protein